MIKNLFIKLFLLLSLIFFSTSSFGFVPMQADACDKTIVAQSTVAEECQNNDTLTVTSAGSIEVTGSDGVDADSHQNVTINNHGTISVSVNQAIDMQHAVGTTVTNTGTIEATLRNAILMDGANADNNTIDNSGTLKAGKKQVILATNSENTTIINSGTIEATNPSNSNTAAINYYNTSGTAIDGATITNSGTIFGYNTAIRFGTLGIASKAVNNVTLTNSGTIEADINSIVVNNVHTTGTNIITKDEGSYIGNIDLNESTTTFTLDCTISIDQDIELTEKTNMSITNNLCGNDTYQILDANKNLDLDNSETNGYLRIYGEELDLISDNKKHRTEILKNTLSNVFKSTNEIKEQSAFYSVSKRDNIYSNTLKGVTGYFLKNNIEEKRLKSFLTYFEQNANFNSKEKSNSENIAFGYKLHTSNDNFLITSIFGISKNKITDVETESNEIKDNDFYGQFLAVHSDYKFNKITQNNNELSINIISEYGAHRVQKYITNFSHGDLSVDEAIDQIFSIGFDVEYSVNLENGFVLKPYTGLSYNNTLSNDIEINDINGAGLKENVSQGHVLNGVPAKKIGFTFTKNTDDYGITLNLEHNNINDLIDNNVNISLSKKLQRKAKKRREEEKLNPELEKLFERLQIVRENERIYKVANKLNKENQIMKDLILELIKQNQKLKTENNLLIKNLKN